MKLLCSLILTLAWISWGVAGRADSINFSGVGPDGSIEGLGTVDSRLNIETSHHASQVMRPGSANCTYGWNGASPITCGGIDADGGFGDTDDNRLYDFAISFAAGLTAKQFSVRMLDFGDFNPYGSTLSIASVQALNGVNTIIASRTLSFTHDSGPNPTTSSAGNLQITGDATAPSGNPGNFAFSISATGMTEIDILFFQNGTGEQNRPSDPNIAFDNLNITFELNSDYNKNGIVDAADYVVWKHSFGQLGNNLPADGNLDGKVDDADYDIWRANFGTNVFAAGASLSADGEATVAEPSTVTLLQVVAVACASIIIFWRRSQCASRRILAQTSVWMLLILLGVRMSAASAATATFDLAADWSDTNNPNGHWAYNGDIGIPLSSHVENYYPGQSAWAFSQAPSVGHIPSFMKMVASSSDANDVIAGKVYVHPNDPFNSPASYINSIANVSWTSPISSTVDIAGDIWEMSKYLGRDVDWRLMLNAATLTSGTIHASDPFNSTSPMDFNLGTGGSSALRNVAVSAGDVLRLDIVRASAAGTFVGIDFRITEQLPASVADFNQNGMVDAADYIVWRKSFGEVGANLPADANFNYKVDAEDYAIWRMNFGTNVFASSGSAVDGPLTVPEPSTMAYVVLAVAFHCGIQKGRRAQCCSPV